MNSDNTPSTNQERRDAIMIIIPLALLVGFLIGFFVFALLAIAKERVPENEGAALLGFEILDLMADYSGDFKADATQRMEAEIRGKCEKAIERAGMHEILYDVNSTNG